MCNKFGFNAPLHRLIELFAALDIDFESAGLPNFPDLEEIKPTDLAPVVRREGEERVRLDQMRWGFPPGRPKAGPVINYRSEGRSFTTGRCLVPATHFFEFTGAKYPKTAWRFTPADGDLFAMAGLWRAGDDGQARFTLLTIDAGPDVAPYHDRQIVPLGPAGWKGWLDPTTDGQAFLKPGPEGSLKVAQASKGPPLSAQTGRLF
ncbi:MAG: SOS response-associated peptidase [Proteobacteria bacterium]|nr:SOS response-associated peptidase [Pseudomonadota bacterium]